MRRAARGGVRGGTSLAVAVLGFLAWREPGLLLGWLWPRGWPQPLDYWFVMELEPRAWSSMVWQRTRPRPVAGAAREAGSAGLVAGAVTGSSPAVSVLGFLAKPAAELVVV